jgi:hypothetical protein
MACVGVGVVVGHLLDLVPAPPGPCKPVGKLFTRRGITMRNEHNSLCASSKLGRIENRILQLSTRESGDLLRRGDAVWTFGMMQQQDVSGQRHLKGWERGSVR